MAIEIIVPRLGWSMEEGTLVEWRKGAGDRIQPGDVLFVLESEKAAEEIESLDAGILHLTPGGPEPGDLVKVGQVLAHLLAEGEAAPQALASQGKGKRAAASVALSITGEEAVPVAGPSVRRLARSLAVDLNQVPGSGPGGRITDDDVRKHRRAAPEAPGIPAEVGKKAISPRARRVAAEMGIDWGSLQGSGRNGRIRERDVRAAGSSSPLPTPLKGEGELLSPPALPIPLGREVAGGRLLPHTNVRRTIAARMVAGVTQAAPVTLTTRLDATNLVNLRRQFKAAATSPDEPVPGYSDLVVKLAAVALRHHPLLQAQWRDDGLFVPERIDIALAVDTDAGLLAPVVRDVDRLTLREVAGQTRQLFAQARAGKLAAGQMRDATFTVTNLGHLGIDAFTPIIHLPQCAVLGVGRIVREPAVLDDRIVPRDRMTLSLTFDHRVVDGAPAALFLDTLRGCLEQPAPWLMP